jgi:conflict system pore-forming effector with SLATT domain
MANSSGGNVGTSNDFPKWDTKNPKDSLLSLYGATVRQGQAAIDWYKRKQYWKRVGSRLFRYVAIGLVAIGALIPLLSMQGLDQHLPFLKLLVPQWGYVVFAVAAGCVLGDKLLGFSTGWIRFIKTQLVLEGALTELRYDWLALFSKLSGDAPTQEQIQTLIQRLRAFVVLVHTQVQQETEAWVLEFQSNLADLEKAAKVGAEATKPGSLQVTVPNAAEFDGGVTATLNGMEVKKVDGTRCLFLSVIPGQHQLLIKGTKAGKTLEASEIVKVSPDTMAAVTVALPTS